MRKKQVSHAIRRAVLVPLAIGACGNAVTSTTVEEAGPADSGTDSGLPADGSRPDAATPHDAQGPGDSAAPCALASTTPFGVIFNCDEYLYALIGDGSSCSRELGASPTIAMCDEVCPPAQGAGTTLVSCSVTVGNPSALDCSYGPCVPGRRPEGLVPVEHGATGELARFLAAMAWLEAASAPAFERLARELEAHGAPARLRRAARRAARDEIRHARQVSVYARRAGGAVSPARVERRPVRSLEAIAIENAVEGCVKETFAAAVAAVQAKRAGDPEFRAVMTRVARDEERHARLSWGVADWLDGILDDAARLRVREARTRAADELLRDAAIDPHVSVSLRLGVPSAREACAMVRSLRESLGW